MSRRKIQIVIVCEDRTHEVFVRRYLAQIGYEASAKGGKVKSFVAPPGVGSGEQFVLAAYGRLLADFRNRNPQFHRLVAIVDADVGTVREHEAELALAATATGQLPRQPHEGILHLIPKRNVETWIHRLLGNAADEDTDYKPIYRNQDERDYCQPAAVELAQIVRTLNRGSDLPSLEIGIQELRQKLSGSH